MRLSVPGQNTVSLGELQWPASTTSDVQSFQYPRDGSIVSVGRSRATVFAQRGGAAAAQSFAEVIVLSLFGGEVEWQRADALIDNWQRLLTPLDATQHLLGPIDVRVQGPLAVAECHVRAYHVAEAAAGGTEWVVSGHYVFELLDDGGTWKVAKLTLQTFYQTGNRQLLSQLAGAG